VQLPESCPRCRPYPHAAWRNGQLQSITLKHTNRCPEPPKPIDLHWWHHTYAPMVVDTVRTQKWVDGYLAATRQTSVEGPRQKPAHTRQDRADRHRR
jgi:hypothetical protein